MERTADRDGHHPLGTHLLGQFAGPVDRCRGAGDHDLAGRVVVGDPDVGFDPGAGGLDLVVVEPQHHRHGALVLIAGGLHGVAPLGDEANAVVEGQRARCRKAW